MTTSDDHAPDPAERAVDSILDACAVVVGLGVMALNRIQAVRRQVRSSDGPDSSQPGR